MSTSIGVPAELADRVEAVVEREALACQVVADGDGTVRVVQSEGRQQSDTRTLQVGGWIACEDAFAMAAALEIPRRAMGKLLDGLDVRLRACQLGCF